jgi:hypothetical protein
MFTSSCCCLLPPLPPLPPPPPPLLLRPPPLHLLLMLLLFTLRDLGPTRSMNHSCASWSFGIGRRPASARTNGAPLSKKERENLRTEPRKAGEGEWWYSQTAATQPCD